MHELLVELYPWIVALWVLDALAEPRRGHLLVVSGPGRPRLVRAGLHLAGLSPLAEVIALHDLPWLTAGARTFLREPGRGEDAPLVTGAALEPHDAVALAGASRVGKKLVVASRTVLVAPTPEWAESLRVRLAEGAAGRGAAQLAADVADARALRARQRPYLLALRALAPALAAGALGLWPLAAWAPDRLPVPAEALLLALAGLVLAIAATGAAMLRACGEGWGGSVRAGLYLAVYPVAALRPLGHLSRSLYRRFAPPAALAALLPPSALADFAARELARARLSRAATPPELAPAWEARREALSAVLAAAGLSEAEVSAPPAPEEGAAGYCPLCRAQYRPGFGRCADCGVAAEPLAPGAGNGDGRPEAAAAISPG